MLKKFMELVPQVEQNLSQYQLQSLNLLQFSEVELEQFVHAQASDNPVIDLEEYVPFPHETSEFLEQWERLKWLQNSDYQNQNYYAEDEKLNPIELIESQDSFEETLVQHLKNQIKSLAVSSNIISIIFFLIEELDEDGYLRESAEELSDISGNSLEDVKQAIDCLRNLEPAGVGAATLKERLILQLKRQKGSVEAVQIVYNHLDDLAHKRYRRIEDKLKLDRNALLKAQAEIQTLDPHIGHHFARKDDTVYIYPEIIIEPNERGFQARYVRADYPYFSINDYYLKEYQRTQDAEVRSYLKDKLSRAYTLLFFISQREKTIMRCATLLIKKQQSFFSQGSALKPFTMAEAAKELGVHPSTVSRTVKNKYIQCPRGIFPFSFFFEKSASASPKTAMGGREIKARIQEIIFAEDSKAPLSDREITERLAMEGCLISRRTVAKYREELNIAGRAERRQS